MFSRLAVFRATLFCLALWSIFTTGPAYGQFTIIHNIPPDPDIGDSHAIGPGTQINLSDGGAFSAAVGVPEPTSAVVLLLGLACCARFRRRSVLIDDVLNIKLRPPVADWCII